MTDGPLLWYLNRSTGLVLLVLLTLTVVLGVLALGGHGRGRGLPRFVTQALHRNLALLSVVLLGAHVSTAVVDTYVDIRWWQAVVPVGASYMPLWLGLGAVSLDLIALVVVTTWLRARIGLRGWHAVHLLSWAAWAVAVAHGIGIGTDVRDGSRLGVATTLACVAAVLLAGVARLVRGRRLAPEAVS
jgi:sulfoxide reductase heme-binding subunit YedZ